MQLFYKIPKVNHCNVGILHKKSGPGFILEYKGSFPPIINTIFFSVINVFHSNIINMERPFDGRLQ